MPFLVMAKVFMTVRNAPMPFFAKPIAKQIAANVEKRFLQPTLTADMEFIDSHLARHDWFTGGNFSAADIQMSFPLEAAQGRLRGHYPHVSAWLERIHARPAWQAALANGGPYQYA
jgi:glutathione S-transferase